MEYHHLNGFSYLIIVRVACIRHHFLSLEHVGCVLFII